MKVLVSLLVLTCCVYLGQSADCVDTSILCSSSRTTCKDNEWFRNICPKSCGACQSKFNLCKMKIHVALLAVFFYKHQSRQLQTNFAKSSAKCVIYVNSLFWHDNFAETLYKLTYFDIRARAEQIRWILEVGKANWKDIRISFADWGALKPSMYLTNQCDNNK